MNGLVLQRNQQSETLLGAGTPLLEIGDPSKTPLPVDLSLSADDRFLFVADNNNDSVGGARKLWRFDLRTDGTVDVGLLLPAGFDDAAGPTPLPVNWDRVSAVVCGGQCIAGRDYPIVFASLDQGKTYAEGSKANLKAELRRMGAEASQHEDSKFFFFLSSHGLMWSGGLGGACPATRVAMSFASLKAGGGEDGFLDDCELGDELNDNFRPETRMFVAVDCSFCGGFSDSLTAASGTIPDGSTPSSSGIPAPNRVVITGCAVDVAATQREREARRRR